MEKGIPHSIEGIPPNAGSNSQRVRKGEVVIIHVDGPRMHWQLEVVVSQKRWLG